MFAGELGSAFGLFCQWSFWLSVCFLLLLISLAIFLRLYICEGLFELSRLSDLIPSSRSRPSNVSAASQVHSPRL